MKILTIVGTRPNFVKVSQLIREIKKAQIDHKLVHTGQHYDLEMNKIFFEDLGIPSPDVNLGVGSGSYGEQLSKMILELEKILVREKPDVVLVVGDVTSTLAGALVAKSLGIKIAHVEAGLRSFDLSMQEELNRIIVDRISDFLFTTEESANYNLRKEGVNEGCIFFVGNVMIDTLVGHKERARNSPILERLSLEKEKYCVLTLHRPSNVDNKKNMNKILRIIEKMQEKIKVVFPLHPRTKKMIEIFNLGYKLENMANIKITPPLGYIDFLWLMSNSKFIFTDSGGIQEEATILQIPCITFRNNTERPVTLTNGTNMVVSTNETKVLEKILDIFRENFTIKKPAPELWDGKASERIINKLLEIFENEKKNS